jgi:hypothetical protein
VALKMLARSAQKTVEKVAMETAAVVGPAAKEASIKVEGMAKKAIAQYGPRAQQAAKEFEKTISKLAGDASLAIKGALKSKLKPAPKKVARKPSRVAKGAAKRKPAGSKRTAKGRR